MSKSKILIGVLSALNIFLSEYVKLNFNNYKKVVVGNISCGEFVGCVVVVKSTIIICYCYEVSDMHHFLHLIFSLLTGHLEIMKYYQYKPIELLNWKHLLPKLINLQRYNQDIKSVWKYSAWKNYIVQETKNTRPK